MSVYCIKRNNHMYIYLNSCIYTKKDNTQNLKLEDPKLMDDMKFINYYNF
jgi:hypothetical protein